MDLTPALFLTMWAAGIAGGAVAVGWWSVVGPGYLWLAGATTIVFGGLGWWAGGGWWAAAGTFLAVGGIAVARRRPASSLLFAGASMAYLAAALTMTDLGSAFTGSVALGGVTSEMMLGHWYLVDPRLPRWALQRLDGAGLVGVVVDAGLLLARGAAGSKDTVVVWAFVVLALTTAVLMVAVWFALREPRYSGVMAATGLSYLAMLTVIGAVVAGRSLLDAGGSILAGTLPGR